MLYALTKLLADFVVFRGNLEYPGIFYAITGKLYINQIDCLSLYKIRSPLLLLLLLGLFLASIIVNEQGLVS